jgi:hypothetical protein
MSPSWQQRESDSFRLPMKNKLCNAAKHTQLVRLELEIRCLIRRGCKRKVGKGEGINRLFTFRQARARPVCSLPREQRSSTPHILTGLQRVVALHDMGLLVLAQTLAHERARFRFVRVSTFRMAGYKAPQSWASAGIRLRLRPGKNFGNGFEVPILNDAPCWRVV